MYNLKRSPLSLFIAGTLLASSPLLLQAEDIIYNDTPSMLKTDPTNTYGKDNSLFPDSGFSGNKITFIKGTIAGRIYGGLAVGNETVSNNHVVFKAGDAANVSGGYSREGNVNNNTVTLSGGDMTWVKGGYSFIGHADNNHVIISGGSPRWVDGGFSVQGGANNNSVIFSDGSTGDIYGGASDTADPSMTVSGNKVTFTGGTAEDIYGGESFRGQVTNNTVIFSGGHAEALFGGSSDIGNVTGNSIIFSGGAAKELNGAYSDEEGNATNNSILFSGGSAEKLYGGYSQEGHATGNTITIEKNPQFNASHTFIYGGLANNSSSDAFSGNTLNFSAQPIRINTLANFEHYNVTIDPAHANTTTALITAETFELGADAGAPSKIKVVGIHSGNTLNKNDKFILMKANTMTGYGAGETSTGVAQQGISFLYDIETTVDVEGQRVTATILSSDASETVTDTASNNGAVFGGSTDNNNANSAARANPQLKALSEGYLAGAMLINRGADAIAYNAFDAINVQNNQSGLA